MNSVQENIDFQVWNDFMATLDEEERKKFEAYIRAVQREFHKVSSQPFGKQSCIHLVMRMIYFLDSQPG
jgi:hypothetical protein